MLCPFRGGFGWLGSATIQDGPLSVLWCIYLSYSVVFFGCLCEFVQLFFVIILTETITSEKKHELQDLGLSLCWITRAKAKRSLWEFALFHICGLLLCACPTCSLRRQM